MVFHYLGGKCYQLPEIKDSLALFSPSFPLCCGNYTLEQGQGNYDMSENHVKRAPSEGEVCVGKE